MKVSVRVKPNSKKESVVRDETTGILLVRVNAPPADGKANQRVIELLAEFFNRPKSSFELLHGASGKNKIFKIS